MRVASMLPGHTARWCQEILFFSFLSFLLSHSLFLMFCFASIFVVLFIFFPHLPFSSLCDVLFIYLFFEKVVPVYCICLRNMEHPLERPLITSTHSAIATMTSHDNNDNLELLIWFLPHYPFVLHFSPLPGTHSTKKTSQPKRQTNGRDQPNEKNHSP